MGGGIGTMHMELSHQNMKSLGKVGRLMVTFVVLTMRK